MRTPNMSHDNSQSNPQTGSQSTSQDHSYLRRARLNSIREQDGPDNNHNHNNSHQRLHSPSISNSGLNIDTNRLNKARGPINDAVQSALNPIDLGHAAISPEVLDQLTSQITANVLQQLKQSQLSPASTNAPSTLNEQMDSISSTADSPPIDRDRVYTPPSPYRTSDETAQPGITTSPKQQSKLRQSIGPKRPPSPPFSHTTLSEDSDTKEGTTRARAETASSTGTTRSRAEASPPTGTKRSRAETSTAGNEATILEKIWGDLFDDQGKPTMRLSQFLRGIAVHIIEDYEPKHSLVINPDKMQKYYEETKLASEIYPWQVIFDDRTSSISRMFREMEAQHHLVQDRLDERPDIPGLTPAGFATWMTFVLMAHPDEEFERLAYTALHMPVSNPDDKKERFPKELSRRLFPKESDGLARSKLAKVALTHCGVRAPARTGSVSERDSRPTQPPAGVQNNSFPTQPTPNLQPSTAGLAQSSYTSQKPPPPPPDYETLSQTTTRSSIPEIERNALRQTVSATATAESPPPIAMIPPPQIERERKPYVAQPGGGKSHDVNEVPIIQPAESKPSFAAPSPLPSKLTRSASLNTGRPPDTRSRPLQPIAVHQKAMQMPPPTVETQLPSRSRTGSMYHRDPPKRDDRNRSPSNTRSNGVPQKSDSDMAYGSSSGSYHSVNLSDYSSSSWRADPKFDRRGSYSAEPRDREREPRQRFQSISTADSQRNHPHKDYSSEDELHRPRNMSYVGPEVSEPSHMSSPQYPPTSYKNRA